MVLKIQIGDAIIRKFDLVKNYASNSYLVNVNNKVRLLIDAGSLNEIENYEFDYFILTHLHYDHLLDIKKIIPKKKPLEIYLSNLEIRSFYENPAKTILNLDNANEMINLIKEKKIILKDIYEIKEKLEKDNIYIIDTPGHTLGSICIHYENILFSGDTIFHNNQIGRCDLPTSKPKLMEKSLEVIKTIKFEYLFPGHDY